MGQAFFTDPALQDLDDISDYIAQDNPVASDEWVSSIKATCSMLATRPQAGRERADLSPGLHSFAKGYYVIFYRIRSGNIYIIRVLHGSRDLSDIF